MKCNLQNAAGVTWWQMLHCPRDLSTNITLTWVLETLSTLDKIGNHP